MNLAQIEQAADKTAGEVAEIASQLVQRNSAHPDGHTKEVVAVIQDYCDRHGIANEVHANDPNKPNIVAKVKGASDQTLLWLGHIDVVPAGSPEFWTYPPYSGAIADGCVRTGRPQTGSSSGPALQRSSRSSTQRVFCSAQASSHGARSSLAGRPPLSRTATSRSATASMEPTRVMVRL